MKARGLSDAELLVKLNAHPELRSRFESILSVVGDDGGDLKEADAAEARMIEEVRRLGQESLTAWALRQVEQTTAAATQVAGVWREGKKNSVGTVRSGE